MTSLLPLEESTPLTTREDYIRFIRENSDHLRVPKDRAVLYSGHHIEDRDLKLHNGRLAALLGLGLEYVKLEETRLGQCLEDLKLSGTRNLAPEDVHSIWAEASRLFVEQAEGNLTCFTFGASKSGIFRTIELSSALNNAKITSINQIPKENLLQTLKRAIQHEPDRALDAVYNQIEGELLRKIIQEKTFSQAIRPLNIGALSEPESTDDFVRKVVARKGELLKVERLIRGSMQPNNPSVFRIREQVLRNIGGKEYIDAQVDYKLRKLQGERLAALNQRSADFDRSFQMTRNLYVSIRSKLQSGDNKGRVLEKINAQLTTDKSLRKRLDEISRELYGAEQVLSFVRLLSPSLTRKRYISRERTR